MTTRADWVVFGDDWGRHPSTTQHLVAHLPPGDRVLWIDSLGMRAPTASVADLRRLLGKLTHLRTRPSPRRLTPADDLGRAPTVLAPHVLPWHTHPAVARLNRALLGRQLRRALAALAFDRPLALLANPVAALYVDLVAPSAIAYLRLDDFAHLPGVDPTFIHATEPALLDPRSPTRILIVAPNARLLPAGPSTLHLPQGVDLDRFALPPEPPPTRVLGYWGLLSPWLDLDLVAATARRHPDWTLELRGPIATDLAPLRGLPNVHVLPPVPHHALAAHAAHWRAAWMPSRTDPGLLALSPLKLREYLAAGLPTACTDLPEAHALPLAILRTPTDLDAFLADALADTPSRRAARRASQADAGWSARAALLRARLLALASLAPRRPLV